MDFVEDLWGVLAGMREVGRGEAYVWWEVVEGWHVARRWACLYRPEPKKPRNQKPRNQESRKSYARPPPVCFRARSKTLKPCLPPRSCKTLNDLFLHLACLDLSSSIVLIAPSHHITPCVN